jgi:hypothetical protein
MTRTVPRALVAGVASTAAFAVGCVLTQAVTVPTWRRMEPETFLERFATTGPATGAVLFPVEAASVGLLGVATASATRRREPGRLLLAAATGAVAGTVLFLPAYFARTNAAFLRPGFPTDAVAAELAAWNRWKWVRTGLAAAATVLSGAAAVISDRPRHSVRPRSGRILDQ